MEEAEAPKLSLAALVEPTVARGRRHERDIMAETPNCSQAARCVGTHVRYIEELEYLEVTYINLIKQINAAAELNEQSIRALSAERSMLCKNTNFNLNESRGQLPVSREYLWPQKDSV